MGILYLLATPIGNMEDVTLRALRVLREVSLVAAEDTRTTRKLLTHHGIRQRVVSYNENNMRQRTPQIIAALAEGDVAFASEAGTPGVSDPGFELTGAAIVAGNHVVAVPGASALLTALVASGLPMREFTFVGFLPRRAGERRRLLESLAAATRTIVAFEAPHRLLKSLADIRELLGNRKIAIGRELTKLHEELFRGTVSEAIDRFKEPRGEFTLVIAGNVHAGQASPDAVETARRSLADLRAEGIKAREAVSRVVAETKLSHRDVYAIWIETRRVDISR